MQWKVNLNKVAYSLLLIVFYGYMVGQVSALTIRKVCPVDEIHKSCAFYEEYVCWTSETRHDRVKISPKRMPHCRSGCYCMKGYVRDFPGATCILAAGCRNHKVVAMLDQLPVLQSLYITTE